MGKKYFRCSDRMCGADDCPRCRPGNFVGGRYIGDIETKAEGIDTMAINSKQKGKRIEREWAAYLREAGFSARRGQQYAGSPDSPDVVSMQLDAYVHFEVKGDEHLNIHGAVRQAINDCRTKKWRVVAHKKNRQPWLVTMPAEDWVDLMKSYLYSREIWRQ